MATGKRSGKGIKNRQVGETAGIRPHKLDAAFDNDTDFLNEKSDVGEASSSAEQADWYYNSVQDCFRFYNGSRWANVEPADNYVYEDFKAFPSSSLKSTAGGAAAGTTGALNMLNTGKALWEQFILGAGQTIIVPAIAADGLDISLDQTDNEGAEYNFGITDRGRCRFTIGTSPAFFVTAKIKVADVSGCDPLLVGFRKAAANAADYNDYTDFAAIGFAGTADIKTQTALNNAATVTTDTTVDGVDTEAWTFTVKVGTSGIVTYEVLNASGTTQTLTTAAYTFDTGDVVMPFVHFLHGSDVAGTVQLQTFECGYQLSDN